MTTRTRLALAPLALALSLGLAGCGSSEESAAASGPSAAPIAAIAAPAGQAWSDMAAVTPEGGYVVGNPNAPIKLLEYASHTCSHCAQFAQESAGNIERYIASGRVSYEIRNQIHDPLDLTIAMLARCGEPTTFHPLAHQVWTNLGPIIEKAQANTAVFQSTAPNRFVQIADATGMLDFVAARGIPRDQASQCLSDPAKAEAIANASTQQSEELGVTGTPTFFINGNRIDAAVWSEVEAALQQAGAR